MPYGGSPDDRAAVARALALVSTVTSISLEMVLPAVAGYWLDRRLGWLPGLTIVGGAAGLALGIWTLIRWARQEHARQAQPPDRTQDR